METNNGQFKKGQRPWNYRHGINNRSPVYRAWESMKHRCLSKNATAYKYYGGRGIKICKRWLMFDNFYSDMGHPPQSYQLDRINNNLGYNPKNCRWATKTMQMNNTNRNHFLVFNGKRQTMADWCRELGMKYWKLSERLHKWNWSVERALSTR